MWIQMKDAWRRDGDCQWLSMAAIDCLTVSDSWRSAARCRRVVAGDVACRRSGRTRKCDANASSLPASVEDVMVCKAWHVMQLWFFWQADLIIQRQIEALLSSHLLWRVRKQDRSPPTGKRLVYRFTTIIYSCHDATWTPVQDLCELIVWGESDQFLDTDRGVGGLGEQIFRSVLVWDAFLRMEYEAALKAGKQVQKKSWRTTSTWYRKVVVWDISSEAHSTCMLDCQAVPSSWSVVCVVDPF